MRREIELKFRVADPDGMRERLSAAGARFVSKAFESNRIFDTRKRKLRSKGCGLRVRTSDFGDDRPAEARFTFKGPRDKGEFKSREELEVTVSDADTLAEMLSRLKLNEVIHYEKRRETWVLGECEVVLDEMPRLGWWLEIEAATEEAVTAGRERLGLSDAPVAEKTYVAMALAEGSPDDEGCVRLVFEA